MTTAKPSSETNYLWCSAGGNILLAAVGMTMAVVSSSQAILLDGLFNLTYFATGLFTVKVAKLVARGDDDRFPHGYAFFEPLVNGIKGLLVCGVSLMAVVGAVEALFTGGREISAGPAIAYGIFATLTGIVVWLVTRRGAKVTGSPLVKADAENWVVNSAISACVLLAFVGIFVLQALDVTSVVPYVDPIVVLSVVLISLSVPIRMAWQALMALLNRAPSPEVVERVTKIVDHSLSELPVEERFIRVIQPGRQRMVLVHVVLAEDFRPHSLQVFDEIRQRTFDALHEEHVATLVDLLFTADRQWGAPLSDGGSGG